MCMQRSDDAPGKSSAYHAMMARLAVPHAAAGRAEKRSAFRHLLDIASRRLSLGSRCFLRTKAPWLHQPITVGGGMRCALSPYACYEWLVTAQGGKHPKENRTAKPERACLAERN